MTPSCPVRRSEGAPGTSCRPPCGPVVRATAGRNGQGDSRPASTALAESTATVRATAWGYGANLRHMSRARRMARLIFEFVGTGSPRSLRVDSGAVELPCRTVAPACSLDRGSATQSIST